MQRRDNGAKRPVNLSLSETTLERARAMGMNLSATVDQLLAAEVERQYWARWNEDNKEAIAAYNARIEREGLWSDRYRTFMRPESAEDGQDAA